ncbi:hypothetical protein NVP1076O_69 [Vibrio phage 1.076.O._10N.286.51.B7]|nr:hypothetical protein NVP1076O_69 [Vibrio phage 1.076.O._10N.286.51.B7]
MDGLSDKRCLDFSVQCPLFCPLNFGHKKAPEGASFISEANQNPSAPHSALSPVVSSK